METPTVVCLAQAGGSVTTILDIQPTTVSGFMNFTQRPEEPLVLCGAGNLQATRNNDAVSGSFISNDDDPGCTYDDGGKVTITATVKLENKLFYGNYVTNNNNGSNFDQTKNRGVFEVWEAGSQPTLVSYEGQFNNSTVNRGGRMIINIAVGQQIVYGYVNATNEVGQPPLCGAGFFTGYKKSNGTIEFSFASDDKDAGCGFDRGSRNIFQATFSSDQKTLTGSYVVGNSGGTYTLNLVQKIYIPLATK